MAERAYTVKEIDALKRCHDRKFLYGRYAGREGMSRSYTGSERDNYVEQATRTSMMAGHTAEDLLASEEPT